MRERVLMPIRIGFTYIGTVVGAGFASGQETLQFFTLYGTHSMWGIGLCMLLFVWFGTRMMLIGHRIGADSYKELNVYLFGDQGGRWMNILVSVTLFGITTTMMSGVGSLFEEHLGLSFHLGVILTLMIAMFFIVWGMEGILSVNTLVVPLMFLLIIYVAYHCSGGSVMGESGILNVQRGGNWLLSALIYAAFNLAMAQAVLVPLGKETTSERSIWIGGIIGGVGFGVMLFASNYVLLHHLDDALRWNIPMALVISTFGTGIRLLFFVVIWCEILTTIIGNVYGLAINLSQASSFRLHTVTMMIFLLGYVCSSINFSLLVRYMDSFFGYCGLILLVLLLVRPIPKRLM